MAVAAGQRLIFSNVYHLLLHPGPEVVASFGGLHKYMGWTGPILTDSGGFQGTLTPPSNGVQIPLLWYKSFPKVFSLQHGSVHNELKCGGNRPASVGPAQSSAILKVNEEGVLFRSYRDGAKVLLTPETSVQAQKLLGADIIIPLDELIGFHTSGAKV